MILDIIAIGVVFYAGVFCGKKYGGITGTYAAAKAKVKSWLPDDTPHPPGT